MNKKPRILLFDIENTPLIGYSFGLWETNILATVKDWNMLCFSYKWLGDKKTKVIALPDFKGYSKDKSDDKLLVKQLWILFEQADIIIGHNSDQFDIKKANARFAYHKLPPPSPYKTVDTKKVAKRYFKFDSNKLTELGRFLKLGVKEETGGIQLWFDCMAGVDSAWKKMKSYNIQDVVLLEKIYLELRPWITNHPSLGVLNGDRGACPACGSVHVQFRGTGINSTTKYQRLQCQDCSCWFKGDNIKL